MEKEPKPFTPTSANIAKGGISEINARWEGNSYIVETPFHRAEYIYEDNAHAILLKVIDDDRVAWCHHGSNIVRSIHYAYDLYKCTLCGCMSTSIYPIWHINLGPWVIPYVSLRKRGR